ncbi:hypothetical protein [Flavobacterium tructae]|uniref:Uncharacterized protein n=1 Tax=Flavobacterium tructae TaxID=1114873 RepID=A0A1S1J1E0_9FLAO|nr:hypothetical protein [Flavobacterium tructae]OHT44417.1 hypothetical protein BHE19_11900 [Flavobacterium tructae]OXB19447.1 hypothetical protein B0A71_12975 [Flavobacterium tructae]
MSFQSIITKQVALLTDRLNAIANNAKKIVELPWQSVLRPNSEIHVSDSGTSYKIKIQQIFDWFNSVRQNQLVSANVSIIANDIVVATGAQWIIGNVNYATVGNTSFTIEYAETGYTRNDILVANKNNQIIRILGPETEGTSPTPPTPIDTVLVTIINVTDSTIGNTPPIIGGDYEKVVNKQNSLTVDGTGKKYPTVDAVNSILVSKEDLLNKATNFTTVNDILYPSVAAVKAYADNLLVGVINLRGVWDASGNLFPITGGSGISGAIQKGDLWYVSVAGVLAGKSVNVGDSFFALVNSPNQVSTNWNVIESNIGYVPANDANVLHTSGNESFTGVKSSTNTTNSQSSGLDLTNNGGAPGSTVFKITNSSTGRGGQVINSGGGSGFYIINNSNGNGLASVNNGIGNAFTSANNSSGTGFAASNTSTGSGIYSVNDSTGIGVVSNGSSGSTGFIFAGQNNGVNTFTINKSGDTVLNSATITTVPTTSAGAYDVLTRDSSTGVVEKVLSSSFAADSNVVHKNGNETIAGVKSLSERLQFATDQGFTSGGSMPFIHRSGDHIAVCSTTLAGTARLDTKNITTSSPKTFSFPNKDGTFAMTSDLLVILTGAATLDFPNTAPGTSQDLNISVPGAALGDVVSLGVPYASVEPNSQYTAFVSASNVVTVRFVNFDTSTARNPVSGDFKVKIIK